MLTEQPDDVRDDVWRTSHTAGIVLHSDCTSGMETLFPSQSPIGTDLRPSKRTRKACDNCRRKKARCSGDTPACSLCARLSQRCRYSITVRPWDRHSQGTPRSQRPYARTRSARPDLMAHGIDGERPAAEGISLESLNTSVAPFTRPSRQIRLSSEATPRASAVEDTGIELASNERDGNQDTTVPFSLPPWPKSVQATEQLNTGPLVVTDDLVTKGVALYLERFYCQPCPLLSNLKAGCSTLPPSIVLYSLLALSLQTSPEESRAGSQTCHTLAGRAWELIADAYGSTNVDEAYLEAVCLMAQRDFAIGNTFRARTQIAHAFRAAQIIGASKTPLLRRATSNTSQRYAEIVWSLFMLDRMFSGTNFGGNSLSFAAFEHVAPPAVSLQRILQPSEVVSVERSCEQESILTSIFDLMSVWENLMTDMSELSIEVTPLWRFDSKRSQILSRLLELEIRNYTVVGSAIRVHAEPQMRPYLRSWLFYQILHSGIHCYLNHPFILYVKVRTSEQRVPFTFLQESYRHSRVYADWICRFVAEMEEADLMLYDPFVGFLVAIGASIHLESTLQDDTPLKESSSLRFQKCVGYISRLADVWPNARHTLHVILKLEARLHDRGTMHYVQEEFNGAQPRTGGCHVALSDSDTALMWELFDYTRASQCQRHSSGINMKSCEDVRPAFPQVCPGCSGNDQAVHLGANAPQNPSVPGDQLLDTHLQDVQDIQWDDIFESQDDQVQRWSLLGMPWLDLFPA